MARSQFGGRSEQVGVQVAADQSLKLGPNAVIPALYDKPVWDGTRVVVTDFLLDSAGAPGAATSTLTTDDSGIPQFFWGPDSTTILYDLAGHAFYANRGTDGLTVVSATESLAGVAEISTAAEADTGADHTRIMPPDMVKRRIDAHNVSSSAHDDLRTVVNDTQTLLSAKADLVSGTVPHSQLPEAEGVVGGTLAVRRATGNLTTGAAAFDDEAVPLLQVRGLIASGAGSGADVRDLPSTATPGAPLTATGTGSWVTVAGMQVVDAASGQKWKMSGSLPYRSTAVAGVQVRFKIGAAAVTNQLLNPSFATDASNWTPSGSNTIARATALTAQDGTGYGLLTATSTATIQLWSEWHPTTPGVIWSAGGYARLVTGTAKTFRVDVQYGDSVGTVLRSGLGTAVTPVGGSWTRSVKTDDTTGGPTGTTQARVRVTYVTPAVSDAVAIDAIQLEQVATLPAYGSTGGSGSSAFTIEGDFRGPIVATPTANSYSRVIPIEYPTDSNVTAAFGGLGATTTGRIAFDFDVTVGGTGLTGQRIEFEFADNAADGSNHATIRGGTATFARVV